MRPVGSGWPCPGGQNRQFRSALSTGKYRARATLGAWHIRLRKAQRKLTSPTARRVMSLRPCDVILATIVLTPLARW